MAARGKDSGSEKEVRIDLGLSELIAGNSQNSQTEAPAASPSSSSATELTAQRADEDPSPLQRLAEEGRWSELVQAAETELTVGDSGEARVWWVRAHLAALSMPASFLASPLEALCRKLAGSELSPGLRRALCDTGPELLRRLEDVGDRDQAEGLRAALLRLGIIAAPARERRKSTTSIHSITGEPFALGGHAPDVSSVAAKRKDRVGAHRGMSLGRVVAGGATLVTIAVVLWWIGASSGYRLWGAETVVAGEEFVESAVLAEQVIPASDSRDQVGSLSALFYSIRGSEGDGRQPPADTAQPSRATDQSASEVPSSSKPKERVDTTGPIEGPEFRRDSDFSARRRRDQDGIRPQLPPVNGSPVVRPERPAVDVGSMGRVVRSTSVYSGASYGADILGQLEVGDRVMIEGNSGRWLRLRSRRGRGGYVRREDVEFVP